MNQTVEETIYDVPRRPRMGDASSAALIGAVALGLLTRDWAAALAGGAEERVWHIKSNPLNLQFVNTFRKKG